MSKWKNYKKYKPKTEDSYIVAWSPIHFREPNKRHFYALWNYSFDDEFIITGPAKIDWNNEIEILAWRKLPKEYKGEDKNEN